LDFTRLLIIFKEQPFISIREYSNEMCQDSLSSQDDPDQVAFNYHYRLEECLWDQEIAASINEKETGDEGNEPQNKAE
jgi:hypothetical protein